MAKIDRQTPEMDSKVVTLLLNCSCLMLQRGMPKLSTRMEMSSSEDILLVVISESPE